MDASGWKSCTDWSRTWRWRRSRSCSSVTRWSHISRTSCRRWRPRATWRASTSRSALRWLSPRPRSAACCLRRSSKMKLRWDAFAAVAVWFCFFVRKIKQQVLWEVHWVCQYLNPEMLLGLEELKGGTEMFCCYCCWRFVQKGIFKSYFQKCTKTVIT